VHAAWSKERTTMVLLSMARMLFDDSASWFVWEPFFSEPGGVVEAGLLCSRWKDDSDCIEDERIPEDVV